ncbi:MAG: hypothetical protein M3017_01145, partial [Actinomycetota bacterium]|nr:hypothetical protein [Actinomycetota bacterium]
MHQLSGPLDQVLPVGAKPKLKTGRCCCHSTPPTCTDNRTDKVVGCPWPATIARLRCWASLWTDRAVAYRAANGIGQREVGIAVVVQRMVQAEVAGVVFTAKPVSGTRRRAVIDAGQGMWDAVVSWAVNPDHFVLDTSSGRVLERRPGNRP